MTAEETFRLSHIEYSQIECSLVFVEILYILKR